MTYPRVLVWAPTLYESGFKQHHIDGEAVAVQASLQAAGYDSVLLDAYYRDRPAASLSAALDEGEPFHVVVAHLSTSDAYGPHGSARPRPRSPTPTSAVPSPTAPAAPPNCAPPAATPAWPVP
ncbi:hypothetical protein [Dactylosporangium sp. CA-139066]|uniref:hypothetical protein n=1 Tax=Dactylosporangium sp. CA-139066 TaxID=3239930 RepID=UPI003D944664